MQVKKFEAPTMQEALKVIKRELGPDAIILSMKHIKSGFGLMSKASVEVTAAIAEKELKKKSAAEKNLPQNVKEKIWNGPAEKQSEIYDSYFEKQLKRINKEKVEISIPAQKAKAPAPAAKASGPATSVASAFAARQAAQLSPHAQPQAPAPQPAAKAERRYIDITDEEGPAPATRASSSSGAPEKVQNLERDIQQLRDIVVELASGASARGESEQASDISGEMTQVMHDLVTAGIEKKYAREIIREVSFDSGKDDARDEQEILDKAAYQLMQNVKVKDLLEGVGAKSGKSSSTIYALVGPTGVGKTTTIAKIASLAILEKKLRVGLINLDSYKVAAADQLATYAKIMNVPFRTVNSREELQQAIYDFSSLDLILIDTTGRSQKDQESLLQLRHMLASIEGYQCVLTMSATTKDTDINEVASRFKIFNPLGLIFSKLDETNVYGCIYNAQKRTGLPLLYFTVGQRVPEDIEKASAERVVDLVLSL